MRSRLAAPIAALAALALTQPQPSQAQGRIIDEGTFAVTRAGVVHTENFRIVRIENGLVRATGQLVSPTQRISSSLTVDSLGTPVQYDVSVTDKGAKATSKVSAVAGAGRLRATSNTPAGDESMREYALTVGHSLLVDDVLVHELFFVVFGHHPGSVQLIDPRGGHAVAGTLAGMGLEPVEIGGKSVTATHYSLVSGGVRRDFWVDASGRMLRVEIPSMQLVATREEAPK